MASPPFNPNEAVPSDNGIVSQFPGQERTFREIIESWIIWEHGRSGHHAFLRMDTSTRDADSTWEAGSVVYNTTLGSFQFVTSIGPVVWRNLSFETGVRMFFNQTAATLGWTKESNAAYENAGIKLTTGTVDAPTGDVAWGDIFSAAYEIAGATEGHAITANEMAVHAHGLGADTILKSAGLTVTAGGASGLLGSLADSNDLSNTAGNGEEHAHDIELSLDIALKTVEAIVAVRD
jgi:hypothetical protein